MFFFTVVQLMDVAPATVKSRELVIVVSSNEVANYSSNCLENALSTSLSAFRAGNGAILWDKNTTDDIKYLNCSVVDVNKDGVIDCLLFTSNQRLFALDSTTGCCMLPVVNLIQKFLQSFFAYAGSLLWEVHNVQDHLDGKMVAILDFDSALNSNNNTVADLMAIAVMNSAGKTLIAFSGQDGTFLWKYSINDSCTQAKTVEYVLLNPFCINNGTGTISFI